MDSGNFSTILANGLTMKSMRTKPTAVPGTEPTSLNPWSARILSHFG